MRHAKWAILYPDKNDAMQYFSPHIFLASGQRGRYVSMSTDSWHACNCLDKMVCFLRHKLFGYVELRKKTSYAIWLALLTLQTNKQTQISLYFSRVIRVLGPVRYEAGSVQPSFACWREPSSNQSPKTTCVVFWIHISLPTTTTTSNEVKSNNTTLSSITSFRIVTSVLAFTINPSQQGKTHALPHLNLTFFAWLARWFRLHRSAALQARQEKNHAKVCMQRAIKNIA